MANRQTARGLEREGPLCWLIVSLQSLATVHFPDVATQHEHGDVESVSRLLQIVAQLRQPIVPAVPGYITTRAANLFIDYINTHYIDTTFEGLQHGEEYYEIGKQQDAREALGFLLTAIYDINTDRTFLAPVSAPPQGIDPQANAAANAQHDFLHAQHDRLQMRHDILRQYMLNTFVVQTVIEMYCPTTHQWRRTAKKEKQYILPLTLPKNQSRRTVYMQTLFNNLHKEEKVAIRQCPLCSTGHWHSQHCKNTHLGEHRREYKCVCGGASFTKKRTTFELTPDRIIVVLVRYEQDATDATSRKNTLKVACTPVVLKDINGKHNFVATSLVQHDGATPAHGHYFAEQLLRNGNLVTLNDDTVKPLTVDFGKTCCYIIVYEKMRRIASAVSVRLPHPSTSATTPHPRDSTHTLHPTTMHRAHDSGRSRRPLCHTPHVSLPHIQQRAFKQLEPNNAREQTAAGFRRVSTCAKTQHAPLPNLRQPRKHQDPQHRVSDCTMAALNIRGKEKPLHWRAEHHAAESHDMDVDVTLTATHRPGASNSQQKESPSSKHAIFDPRNPPLDTSYSINALQKILHLRQRPPARALFKRFQHARTLPTTICGVSGQFMSDVLAAAVTLRTIKAFWLHIYYYGTLILSIVTKEFEATFRKEKMRLVNAKRKTGRRESVSTVTPPQHDNDETYDLIRKRTQDTHAARTRQRKANAPARAEQSRAKHAARKKVSQQARDDRRAARQKQRTAPTTPVTDYRGTRQPPDVDMLIFNNHPAPNMAVICAAHIFHGMMAPAEDTRRAPVMNQPNEDHAGMLKDWGERMGHDMDLLVCGACGKRAPMSKKEYRRLPFVHAYIAVTLADETTLPPRGSLAWQAKHLVCHEGRIYKLTQRGIKDNLVLFCRSCCTAFKSAVANQSKCKPKPPCNTFAHYDVGKIPSYLEELSIAERLAIARVIIFTPLLQMKKIAGSGCTATKGHAFAMRMKNEDIVQSIEDCLPRADLGKRIQLAIHGKQETYRAVKMTLRRTDLALRLDVMLKWLVWLKKVGNPAYQNITIPTTDAELDTCRQMLLTTVETILDNASLCDSRMVDILSENTRAAVADVREGLDAVMSDAQTNAVLLTDESGTEEPMTQVFAEIAKKMRESGAKEEDEDTHEIKRTLINSAINEYTGNDELFSGGFPHLFPFGITAEVMGTGTVPERMCKGWFELYDARFAKDKTFLFLNWDQMKRHSVNTKVSFVVKRGGQRVDEFVDLVNGEGFYDRVQQAAAAPDSKDARALQRAMEPMIRICGRKVPWSVQEKNDALNKLYSMTHFFCCGTQWITVAPAMRHNKLALRLAVEGNGKVWEFGTLPDIELRSKLIADNPVVATRIFYRLLRSFFEILVKCPLEDLTGRRANVAELLARMRGERRGVFGTIRAAFGVLEEQASGNLHCHLVLFGGWSIDHLMLHIHKPEVQRDMVKLLNKEISCEIAQRLRDAPGKPRDYIAFACEAHPTAGEVKERAQRQSARLNHHMHSATCWKKNCTNCRMSYKRPQSKQTRMCQIVQDPSTKKVKAVRKYPLDEGQYHERIDPPPTNTPGNPFANRDQRVVGLCLQRRDEFEQNQVEQNDMITVCTQCNTSIQPLVTSSQGKAAKYYICKYCAKNPYKLQRSLALLKQSLEEMKKYGTQADDAGTETRVTKQLMQKALNKTDIAEVSDQQAAGRVLREKSYVSTVQFKHAAAWEAVRVHRERYGLELECEDELQDACQLNFTADSRQAMTTTPFQEYQYRGPALRFYALFLYSGVVATKPRPKRRTAKKTSNVGRPPNTVFEFAPGSAPAKCNVQTIMSCPCIPRIAGGPPPAYPGNPPDAATEPAQHDAWLANARIFVEFYVLLFVPLYATTLCPIAEYNRKILPWQGLSSWTRYLQWMEDWNCDPRDDPQHMHFERGDWRIMRNMIDNLRLKADERKLVMAWRNQAADPKPSGASSENDRRGHRRTEDDEELDHAQIVIEHLRATYGADRADNETTLRNNQKYVRKQLATLAQLAAPAHRTTPTRRTYPDYTLDDCLRLRDAAPDDAESNAQPEGQGCGTDTVVLHSYQQRAAERMQRCFADNEQVLMFLQGENGSGKTFVAAHLSKLLGLDVCFTATTNQAAALLPSGTTIDALIKAGINDATADIRFTTPCAATRQHIIDKLRDKDVVLIDESSMLDANKLALVDFRLRIAFGKDQLFAGKHVLLVGDFMQFKPVGGGKSLYEALLRYTKGQHLPTNTQKGAQLFSGFTMIEMNGQARCTPPFHAWISQLRDMTKPYPVTSQWLKQLLILKKADMRDPTWEFATIAVTGRYERRALNKYQAQRFGHRHGEPVLRWICPMKSGGRRAATTWHTIDEEVEGMYGELVRFFVRGGPCILNEKLDDGGRITKGSTGTFVGIVWEDEEDRVDLDTLPPGEITNVPLPDYVLVSFIDKKTGKEVVKPLKRRHLNVKHPRNRHKTLRCLGHGCDLCFACTFHSLQGTTQDRLILSLNANETPSVKIKNLDLTSLLVGSSRVPDFGNLRALPHDAQRLLQLEQVTLLPEFFANYNEHGQWQMDGFKGMLTRQKEAATQKMALALLADWTLTELHAFARDLDMIVTSENGGNPLKNDYVTALRPQHTCARSKLLANGAEKLRQEQEKWKDKLLKRDWRTMPTKQLKTWAKCIGMTRAEWYNDTRLYASMKQWFAKQKKKKHPRPATTNPRPKKRRRLQ